MGIYDEKTEQNDSFDRRRDSIVAESYKAAKSKRELAWELLQASRNPLYVSLRYDYPLQLMEEALAKIIERESAKAADGDKPARGTAKELDSSSAGD